MAKREREPMSVEYCRDLVIWSRPRTGGVWERYHPAHADIDAAIRERDSLSLGRPDREYVILLDGDPAPCGVEVVCSEEPV